MTQSYLGITLDIIDYYPIDFDYNSFSFIFISESKDFEREISYFNANQICQKIQINKKNIKYYIKVTKEDSLIGISEFIIPSQIINKKEKVYDQICTINMTDSIKKLLFGSIMNSIPLKIGIHATLQYLGGNSNTIEKNDKKEKLTIKKTNINNEKKEEKLNPFSPPKFAIKDKYFSNSNSGFNNKINSKNLLNNSVNKIQKKGDSFISNLKNNKSQRKHQRSSSNKRQNQNNENSPKIKSIKNTFKGKDKEKEINNENEKINVYNNNNKKDNELNVNNDNNNNLKENTDKDNKIFELKNNINQYITNKLNNNEINNVNDMINYINDNLKNLLNYQIKYYDLIKKEIDLNHKYNEMLLEYNGKYRTTLVRINKLKEQNYLNDIKKEKTLLNEQLINFNDKEIISLKNKELDILKEILSLINSKNNKNNEEEINNKNEQLIMLIKILKKISNKYGSLNNLLTQSNSTEPQRIILKNIINKYNKELEINNLEINDNEIDNKKNLDKNKKLDKFEYVSSKNPDDIDIKLELFLKQFYLKNQIPKIIFKKTSRNNYEYGTQKIMIKLEGEAIRVRYSGGYLLIDKFIELNSSLEESKKKMSKLNKDNQNKINNKKKK